MGENIVIATVGMDSEGLPTHVLIGCGETPQEALYVVFPVLEESDNYVVGPAQKAFNGSPEQPVYIESIPYEDRDALRAQSYLVLAKWMEEGSEMASVPYIQRVIVRGETCRHRKSVRIP